MARIAPERWRILSPYLEQALDMPTASRGAWLASLGGIDASLVPDLQSLLAEHDRADQADFLGGDILDPRLAAPPSLAGQVVGAYRLVSLIGEGGSGSVWRAERCDGRFEGQVAVKLLNLALLSRSGEERFRREGTILARLRHSRIAHLIDAGVTTTGQPYLVLELVEGETLAHYVEDHALAIEARLRLFLDVLDAVAHAHANLVVHRDIKPGNVIVSAAGEVKLLDFGIAQLVKSGAGDQGEDTEAGALTREIRRALTPEYAAPEQLAGGAVTTATDVYALGVLLHVLLTGRQPGRAADGEFPPASDAVIDPAQAPDTLEVHAARCQTTPARLHRMLRGDLDTIVAKALRKDPAQRYASVTALADDVRRYLQHEPVAARRDTVGYRAARFIRRHVAGLLMSVAVLLLVAGLVAVYTMRLSAERDRARRESAKAVKVSEMLMSLLTSADPYAIRSTPGEPTVRALLDGGSLRVQQELAGEPELQAELLTMMGRTYRRLGLYEKAQGLLEQALASGRQAFGPDDVHVAETLSQLGVVLVDRGDYDGAGRYLERALAMQRRLLGPEHADVAVTLAELGRVYQDQGFGERAEALHREALAVRTRTLGEGHRETAVSQSDLASVLRLRGDMAGAEALLRLSLETNRRTRGPQHPNTAINLHDLALIAGARGDWRTAESQLQSVLAIQRASVGPTHPTVAATLNSLSKAQIALGRPRQALESLEQALAIVGPAFGPGHQLPAIYALNAGALHMTLGEPALALPLLQEGLRVRSRAPGIVPTRRRTVASDDWSVAAANDLLAAAARAAQRRTPIATQ